MRILVFLVFDFAFLCSFGKAQSPLNCPSGIQQACLECSRDTLDCSKCDQQYTLKYFDEVNNSFSYCQKCPNFCLECSSDLQCQQCFDGYFKMYTYCSQCSENCKTCEGSYNTCKTCRNGFRLNSANKCISKRIQDSVKLWIALAALGVCILFSLCLHFDGKTMFPCLTLDCIKKKAKAKKTGKESVLARTNSQVSLGYDDSRINTDKGL